MATLTTSFNIIVKTNAQKWDDIAQAVKDRTVTVNQEYPLKFTDGTITTMRVIDVDDATGDVVFADINGVDQKVHDVAAPSTAISWDTCSGRTYLNGTYLNRLPTNLKNKIKQKTDKYYKTSSSNSNMSGMSSGDKTVITVSDNIWIPVIENLYGDANPTTPNANYTKISGVKQYKRYYTTYGNSRFAYPTFSKSWALASPMRWNYSATTKTLYIILANTTGGLSTMNGSSAGTDHGLIPHFILPGT